MEQPRPSIIVRGTETHQKQETKDVHHTLRSLISYLSHVNRDMLLIWFVGAILTKVVMHNSYQPESYNFIINGVIVLCSVKFIMMAVKFFTKKWEQPTLFKLIQYVDYTILAAWALLFIVGEFMRIGHSRITDTGHMIDTLFITVFRLWCFVFTFILLLFILYHFISKWWAQRNYYPYIDETLH